MVGATPNIATRQPPQSAARVGAVPEATNPGTDTPEEWAAHVDHAGTSRRENFIVMSPLLPRRLRPGFAAVYAFCRTADDLADEQGATPEARTRALSLLASFRRSLHACFACNPR
ncbi:MAG: squalene/phytoene synthase family protein, partial [Planctomycetota bacterium]